MTKNRFIFALSLGLFSLTACDDGLIYEKMPEISREGFNVRLTGRIDGTDGWEDPYSVVLAGFGDSKYAIVQKQLPPPAPNGQVEITLSDIGSEVQTIELCITNKLRERIVSFLTVETKDIGERRDTFRIDAGRLDIGMYDVIQRHIFDPTCANCHGGRETPAAGLFLTAGNSHGSLVNRPSTHVEGGIRVIPGDAANSVLHRVVSPGNAAGLPFSHENMITSAALLKLLDNWIESGAKN